MEESANSINRVSRILVSRNAPIAFVVGVAGFLGSNLADQLLEKSIQVIGIDDFSEGSKRNLEKAIRDKNFHLINESIYSSEFAPNREVMIKLPRVDYAFFVADREEPSKLFSLGIQNFLEFIRKTRDEINSGGGKREGESEKSESEGERRPKTSIAKGEEEARSAMEKPRVVLVSSINLYDNKLEYRDKLLKEAEINFAKYVKHYKINARVVRLAPVFGPRMSFKSNDPVAELIQAALTEDLSDKQSSLDFSSRSIFVDDAVHLIIKSVLIGGTANKIYDGALIEPIKVGEIKQILLDPLWHEQKNFKATELPPWYTPNLEKTARELSWRPKTPIIAALKRTIAYFKENDIEVERQEKHNFDKNVKGWSFKNYEEGKGAEDGGLKMEDGGRGPEVDDGRGGRKRRGFGKRIGGFLVFCLIVFGLVYPIGSLVAGGLLVRYHLKESKVALEEGNFDRATSEINSAKKTLGDSKEVIGSLKILERLGVLNNQIANLEQVVELGEEGIDGMAHATEGSKALFQTTKIISGESGEEPKPLYEKAQTELQVASQIIAKVKAKLDEGKYAEQYPGFIKDRITDLNSKLDLYANLVEKARVASYLMPEVTAIDGKKSYLVLLQNNLELRPTGGFIGSYGKFDFESGRLKGIKVDDIYSLDGGLKEVIEPPVEIKTDLGVNRWYLRDSNFDPDFPTSARQSEFFYKKEAGETVNGVIALDLTASGKLLSAVGGLDLPEYSEHIDSDNLFEKAISHAEAGFFPGSQAKKNYLVSLQTQLFNKVFYLSKQNWPAIIDAMSKSLEQKHLLVYLEDPAVFSYLASANWSGVFPRAAKESEGQTNDFISVVEANLGANKANYYLTRKYNLQTAFGKEGQINHKLKIDYTNSSPSDVFPAGKYRDRARIYLPQGVKINRALWGETDITNKMSAFTDYGRAGYAVLLELMPGEQKALIIDYNLGIPLKFKDESVSYNLNILKQPGTGQDSFDWKLNYPINFEVKSGQGVNTAQELDIATDLLTDRVFQFQVTKK